MKKNKIKTLPTIQEPTEVAFSLKLMRTDLESIHHYKFLVVNGPTVKGKEEAWMSIICNSIHFPPLNVYWNCVTSPF